MFKTDDILVSSWGYDQTNVTFYRVIKTTPKTVTIRQVKSTQTPDEHNNMMGSSVPNPDEFSDWRGDPVRRTVQRSYDGTKPMIKGVFDDFAKLWNGEPQRFTSYA